MTYIRKYFFACWKKKWKQFLELKASPYGKARHLATVGLMAKQDI